MKTEVFTDSSALAAGDYLCRLQRQHAFGGNGQICDCDRECRWETTTRECFPWAVCTSVPVWKNLCIQRISMTSAAGWWCLQILFLVFTIRETICIPLYNEPAWLRANLCQAKKIVLRKQFSGYGEKKLVHCFCCRFDFLSGGAGLHYPKDPQILPYPLATLKCSHAQKSWTCPDFFWLNDNLT